MRKQLASMTIIELVRTANNYATSIKQTGVYSDLIKELSSRLEALNLAYIAQVLTQSATSAEAEQTPASPAIAPLPVERDQYGYWTHPVYEEFCDGREHIPTAEFNAWVTANGLEWTVDYRDEEEIDPAADGYDISKWQPEAPAGDGWFVGSIHDTEDGAVCIWLRNKSEPSPETAAIARQFEQMKGVQP
ncbi:hypothetical protein SAMN04487787_110114 [Kosakonia sacchari]|nr:hypothetical protein SAMN04487787_110114 [Kosakonia sacchari]